MGFMLIAVSAGYLIIPVEAARISRENCDKIQLGWSPEQVMRLLGEQHVLRSWWPEREADLQLTWCDRDDNRIQVYFRLMDVGVGVAAAVSEKEFVPSKLSFYERTRRRVSQRVRALWPFGG